jgi:hypothetical protein
MLINPAGDQLLAVSDKGWWFSAQPGYSASGELTGLSNERLGVIRDRRGRPYVANFYHDAEELTRGDGDKILVAFEGVHRINTFSASTIPPSTGVELSESLPTWLRDAPDNKGVEAMTRLPDGGLLMVCESLWADDGLLRGALRRGDRDQEIFYRPHPEFAPTAAAALPQGDVLFLERYFSIIHGVKIRLVRVAADEIKAGGVMTPELIAELSPPLTVDNFEGLDVRQDAAGRTLVYIISDNNFASFQRTLLLMFELVEP